MKKFIINVGGREFLTSVKTIKKITALKPIIDDDGKYIEGKKKEMSDAIIIEKGLGIGWLSLDKDPNEFEHILNDIRLNGKENDRYLMKNNGKEKYKIKMIVYYHIIIRIIMTYVMINIELRYQK